MSSEAPPEGNPLLVAEIRRSIERAGGSIPFRDFMDLALYHPRYGYYSAAGQKTGRRGDYLTSPRLSPLFGQCLSRFVGDTPVLEMGAGDGSLAAELATGRDYTIIERSLDFKRRQQQRLGHRARWLDEFPYDFDGTVISNELLDALPVHRLVRDQERYVLPDLAEELGEYSTPRLREYFERLGLQPAGDAEVNVDAFDLMTIVYKRMVRGRVLTIDYGYEAHELYAGHPQGTFLTYFRHTSNANPYERIGFKDMTSHVDFTSLMMLGEANGFRTEEFTNQADFLTRLGIGELLLKAQTGPEYFATRKAVMELLNPVGMGGFRVLVQKKGAIC